MTGDLRVLRLHRGNALASGASRWHHSFVVPGLRVYSIRSRGLALESRALAAATDGYLVRGRRARGQVTIVADGELIYRRADRSYTLGPGDVAFDPHIHYDERWAGDRFALLVLEFDESWAPAPGEFTTGRLSPVDRGRAARLTEALVADSRCDDFDALLDLYRGLDVALVRGRSWQPEPGLDALAGQLGLWMSNLHEQPMWTDLIGSGGGAERTLRRRLAALLHLVGVAEPYRGLRPLLNVHRLMTGALLMSAAETSVGEVAATLGYGSARAYCTAARRAGLASPQAIRAMTLG